MERGAESEGVRGRGPGEGGRKDAGPGEGVLLSELAYVDAMRENVRGRVMRGVLRLLVDAEGHVAVPAMTGRVIEGAELEEKVVYSALTALRRTYLRPGVEIRACPRLGYILVKDGRYGTSGAVGSGRKRGDPEARRLLELRTERERERALESRRKKEARRKAKERKLKPYVGAERPGTGVPHATEDEECRARCKAFRHWRSERERDEGFSEKYPTPRSYVEANWHGSFLWEVRAEDGKRRVAC